MPGSPRTPVSRFVHRPLDGPFHSATQFEPAFPGPVAGKGHPFWVLEHRGHELHFGSPEEIAHVMEVLGQRVLPKPRALGAQQAAVSRMVSRIFAVRSGCSACIGIPLVVEAEG